MSFNVEHGEVKLDRLVRIHRDGPGTVSIVRVTARISRRLDHATCLSGNRFPAHWRARVPRQMEPVLRHCRVILFLKIENKQRKLNLLRLYLDEMMVPFVTRQSFPNICSETCPVGWGHQ